MLITISGRSLLCELELVDSEVLKEVGGKLGTAKGL